jgi:hypothetical protein
MVLASDYNHIIHDYYDYDDNDYNYDHDNNRAAYNDHTGTCYFYNCGSSS